MTSCTSCENEYVNCTCTVQNVTVQVPAPIAVTIGAGQGGARGPQGLQGVQGPIGGGIYTFSELPPENPAIGDRWICTLNGYEYTYVDDGDSQQWVDTRTSGFLGPEGIQGTQGLQGSVGVQGPAGPALEILGSYPNEAALLAAHPTGHPGDAYLVNGYLYVWSN